MRQFGPPTLFAAAAAGLVLALVGGAVWLSSRDAGARATPAPSPLPPGDPRLLPLTGIAERVETDELIERADIVVDGPEGALGLLQGLVPRRA